jgi:hypothetical protein
MENDFALAASRALGARDRLAALASEARSSRGPGERRMAEIGASALFEEALLGALRAHLAELKAVAR